MFIQDLTTVTQVTVRLPVMEAAFVTAAQRAAAAGDVPAELTSGPEWAALIATLAGRAPGDKAATARQGRAVVLAAREVAMGAALPIAAEAGQRNLFLTAVTAIEHGCDLPLGEEIQPLLDPFRLLHVAAEWAARQTVPGDPAWDEIAEIVMAALAKVAALVGTWDGCGPAQVIKDGLWLRH